MDDRMGKKKRAHPDVDELLSRPWCYYCERDFEDLKLLISHQKAKHFKCDRCGRRLNTAGGLSVHLNQVHKESLASVENALPNRQGLDVEIFGMEGVPEDIIAQHNQRIITSYYQAQAERHAATGNPPPGQGRAAKKLKVESAEDLKTRLAKFRAEKAAQKAAGSNGTPSNAPANVQSPAVGQNASPGAFNNSPFAPPQQGYAQPGFPGAAAPPNFPPVYPPGGPTPPGAYGQYPPTSNLPARPPTVPTAPSLPQRPGYPANYYPGQGAPGFSSGNASTVEELVAGATRQPQGDDIDALIRMAEAGIKPTKNDGQVGAAGQEAAAVPVEKKSKKDKTRMVYSDMDFSPEERMAALPRYAWVPVA